MSLKKTDMERLKAASIANSMKGAPTPERYGSGSAIVSRREQRRLDQAAGLVPFAVKLKGELVKKLHARAQAQKKPLSEVVDELLQKALKG